MGKLLWTFVDPEVDGIKIPETSGTAYSICQNDIPEDLSLQC
jgi:hypothetical protein